MNTCLSIIVPVFNGARYLGDCLDSLLQQTLQQIEIIVVDDCSTDQTPDVLQEYARKDARIKLIRNEKNLRQGLSRNKAISIATGEYIGFLDADDWVEDAYFEKLYHAAKRVGADMAKASVLVVHPDGSKERFSNLNKEIQAGLREGKPLAARFTYEFWSAIYRRSALLKHGVVFPDIRNGEDLVFLMHAASVLSGIVIVPEVYYFYRQHDASTEAVRGEAYYDSILQAGEKMLELIAMLDYSTKDRMILAAHILRFMTSRTKELQQHRDMKEYALKYSERCLQVMMGAEVPDLKWLELISAGYSTAQDLERVKSSYSFRLGKLLLSPLRR